MSDVEPEACLLVAFEMVAFRTCERAGLMPQAKHGGRGVCAFAVMGSKLDGTGFGKLQMVHTHVAEVVGAELVVDERNLDSGLGAGEAVPLLEGLEVVAVARGINEERLVGLGKRVTFGDALRKPACPWSAFGLHGKHHGSPCT